MSPKTLNSSKFEQDGHENPENVTEEVPIKLEFPNLTLVISESSF